VSAPLYAIYFVGIALEVCLLWRLASNGLWRVYGYLFSYLCYALLSAAAWFVILKIQPNFYYSRLYYNFYWGNELLNMVLRFFIIWEIFRLTFPKSSGSASAINKGLLLFSLASALISAFWGYMTYAEFHSVYTALERSFSFVQAVITLGMLLVAGYYGLQLGRNLWGIAVGFGVFASMLAANNAIVDYLKHSFLPYFYVTPLSFVVMLGMWTWATWVQAPNPRIQISSAAELDLELNRWASDWNRTTSAVRRVTNP